MPGESIIITPLVLFNIPDYDAAYRSFDRQQERDQLSGLPGNKGLNIAYEAVDRHAHGPLANRGLPFHYVPVA